jgi:hypothetical protein
MSDRDLREILNERRIGFVEEHGSKRRPINPVPALRKTVAISRQDRATCGLEASSQDCIQGGLGAVLRQPDARPS